MMKKVALIGGLLALVGAGSAFGAGQFPGYPLASSISGFEYVPADTGDVATRATFTGAISGNTLTVTPPTGALVIQGALGVGQNLRGANLAPGTVITGGSGGSTTSQTWTISPAQTVTSTQMTSGGGGVNPQTEMFQMQQLKAYVLNGSNSDSSYVRTTLLEIGGTGAKAIPTCDASTNGARATITNGVAYSLTLAAAGAIGTAIGSSTGTVTRTIMCGSTNQSTYAWVYN